MEKLYLLLLKSMLFKYIQGRPFKVNDKDFIVKNDTIEIDGNRVTNPTNKQSLELSNEDVDTLKSVCVFISDSSIVPSDDKVNHPSHYTWLKELCGIEVIDITRHLDFNLGNAIKYILRCGHKEELGYSNKEKTIEDLRKAVFYINDKIEMLKRQ